MSSWHPWPPHGPTGSASHPVCHRALQVTLCVPPPRHYWSLLCPLGISGHPHIPWAPPVSPGNCQPPSVPLDISSHPRVPWVSPATLCPLGHRWSTLYPPWEALATLCPTGHPVAGTASHPLSPWTSPATPVSPGHHQPPWVLLGTAGPLCPLGISSPPPQVGPTGHPVSPRDAPHLILAMEEPLAAIAEPGDRAQVSSEACATPCRAVPCRAMPGPYLSLKTCFFFL